MNWDKFQSTMEQYVIKTDVIASEDEYFLVTHMPFSGLEVRSDGKETSQPQLYDEERVYQELVYNPDNIHRMIIVRGNNGTGKSHLIRWLRARFETDPARYNPEEEKIIFLRRLNNTIRGAISQILAENIITDEDMIEKLKRFVQSADSQDPDTFKTTIYHAFVSSVLNDKSGKVYKPIVCKGIADFLYDPRVRMHLLREDGAIDRCYKAITSPSDSVFGGEAIFNIADFKLSRAQMRELANSGAKESQDFAEEIYESPEDISRFVQYLNQFTPKVIQSCAEISSESTREVFLQLRRSLKEQGKGLTIFIEDFTAFTGIDAELITVLASEHGGENKDLCRVTSIIGITDAYYGQFKDNFTDRVQFQINVTENAYGTEEFIVEMAARYLNAIYCDPAVINEWFLAGADFRKLPCSGIRPAYSWETVTINQSDLTLYPFTISSLIVLYNNLKLRTPREFLKNVVRNQLKAFFDTIGGESKFPNRTFIADVAHESVQMRDVQASQIDRLETLSDKDKFRLKLLLAVWGDKTGQVSESSGETLIGGIPQGFLAEVGLGAFKGFGTTAQPAATKPEKPIQAVNPSGAPIETPKQRQYNSRRRDIASWYDSGTELAFSADYRKWVLDYVREAINWQAEEIPAYIAAKRLDQSLVYIEGQSQSIQKDRAIISLSRGIETRDLLQALCEYEYQSGWYFESAAYYQQKLANWLEKTKAYIKAKVLSCDDAYKPWPVLKWCLVVEYLVSNILGRRIDQQAPEKTVISLFAGSDVSDFSARLNTKWNDVIRYIQVNKFKFDASKELLREASKTFMGTIARYNPSSVPFYRTSEIISAVTELKAAEWDVRDTLPDDVSGSLVLNPAELLKELYPRIKIIVDEEIAQAQTVIRKLEAYLGDRINQDVIIEVLNAVSELFIVFNANKIPYNTELKTRFDVSPIERATRIAKAHALIQKTILADSDIAKLKLLAANPLDTLSQLLDDFSEIEKISVREKDKAQDDIEKITGEADITSMNSDCIDYISALLDKVEKLEVEPNVD